MQIRSALVRLCEMTLFVSGSQSEGLTDLQYVSAGEQVRLPVSRYYPISGSS